MKTTVTALELKENLAKGNVCLIDIRDPDEYDSCHIEGSELIPMKSVVASTLPEEKDLVFYCQKGVRSKMLYDKIYKENPNLNIYYLNGGIDAWIKEKFPVIGEKPKNTISIMRQVQIVAGAIVFLGVALGVFLSPWLLLIPTFIGAGLVCSGMSGWCGMAKLIMKMPWNH